MAALGALLALLASLASAQPARGLGDARLGRDDRCWKLLPRAQQEKLRAVIASWPERARDYAAAASPAFPCNLVAAVARADGAIRRHVEANPLPMLDDRWDWSDRHSWPGYQVDRNPETVARVVAETASPSGATRRRDCIGMQLVAFNAIMTLDADLGIGIHVARLVVGNGNPFVGHAASVAAFLSRGDPVDGGVHHVIGIWPVIRVGKAVSGNDDAIPADAVILDYWPTQDSKDPRDIMSRAEFAALFAGLERAGTLRPE